VNRPRRFGRSRLAPATAGLLAALALALVLGSSAGAPAASAASGTLSGTATVDGDVVPTLAHLGTSSFTHPGPLGVGETTLTLPTDGAPVEVWYPATKASVAGKPIATYNVATWLPPALQKLIPAGFAVTYPSGGVTGVPVAPGRYPLIVFSHGYAGFRDQSTFLTAFLASWGFVVAAPDHYSRDLTQVLGGPTAATEKTTDVGDLKATITLMGNEDQTASSAFHGHIDTSKVGAVGHSAGGAAVEALAATDPKVATFIGLAGATVGAFGGTKNGPDSIVPHQPGLLMSGTSDQVVKTSSIVAAYGHLHSPKRLILIRGAGHLVFADLCEVGSGQGGLLAIASALKVPIPASLMPLATDGCKPPDLSPPTAWPVIRQAVTAQLRYVFGFDHSTNGLAGLAGAYPAIVSADRAS
jgi:predicted dienelactone hydrolase